MLHEVSFAGLLFSPLVVIMPLAFLLLWLTQKIMHRLNIRRHLWKPAWFDLAVLICYVGALVWIWEL